MVSKSVPVLSLLLAALLAWLHQALFIVETAFATALRPHNRGVQTLVLKIAAIYLIAVTVVT
jgi:hypothetical protein